MSLHVGVLREHGESVAGLDQLSQAWIVSSMAGIVKDDEFGARPYALQLPGVGDSRLKIKAFTVTSSYHTDQDHVRDTLRVGFAICERQSAGPGAS